MDGAAFFVRGHYLDFLNREPDTAGLDFWAAAIGRCGADGACVERERVNVSAAFFLSIEFRETGFLVHRLRKASDARMPRYAEFLRQTQEVGAGVVVGAPGWAGKLAENQRRFVERWAAGADFRARYGSLPDGQYVDALNQNAGGALSAAERDRLVEALGGGAVTRAQALRAVAEDEDLVRGERDRAFVLMQYFGYLRRDPEAPDWRGEADPGLLGFRFWLGKLEEFGGDYQRAEMVRAFISSIEYRRRFGQ